MAKSGSTPIEFSAKAYLIAGVFAWALAIVAVISALTASKPIVLILAVFWVVISVLCIRAWISKKAT
jgi:hypothetical protein